MDIDRARTFLEIVHTGSFLKAADRLHVTQTTVSARIRTLEEELGRRLFDRNRNGATLTAAVAAAALIGPAQVAARLLEFGLLRRMHPLLSARLATLMHPVGAAVLVLIGAPAAAAFALLHGAGNGILTIAKGTLPLVLFGPHAYGERQGLLMVPARIAQALAPWLFGVCLARWGANALWLSAALGLVAFGALLLLRQDAPADGPSSAPAATTR